MRRILDSSSADEHDVRVVWYSGNLKGEIQLCAKDLSHHGAKSR
jgi:hypothetical protein